MTTDELIEELKKYPGREVQVYDNDTSGYDDPVVKNQTNRVVIAPSWYYMEI